MAKKNREAEAAPPSSGESDSDATSVSSDEDGSPSTDKKSAAQKKPPEPAADKTGDSGSESDGPESDSPVKPMDNDGSKLRKPRSKPNSKPNSAAKTPAKRVAVAEGEKESKKFKTEKGGGGGEEEGKKSVLFQRLWSDDDEIVILEGMLEYKEKKGADPLMDANGFHDLIKKSLHVDVDRRQLVSKVRRLKKRYENSLGKRKTLNPHEKNVLELSKKNWENHMESTDIDQQSKSNMKTRTISKAAAAASKSGGNAGMASPARNGSATNYDGKMEAGNYEQFIGKASASMGLDESIVKVGLELCSEDKKAEIEEKWRKLHLEESDVFLRKLDLVRQESDMIIAAIRSGGN